MDNKCSIGVEFNQLARLLFDASAHNWYMALSIEVIASIIAITMDVSALADVIRLYGSITGVLLVIVAYGLKLRSEWQYDTAETMRRQSVFSEALGWAIDRNQASEWRRQAGKKLRKKLESTPLPEDYYSTTKAFGPERLAEMTVESSFYTRHLYLKLLPWIWGTIVVTIVSVIFVMLFIIASPIPEETHSLVVKIVSILLPTILGIDLIGWGIRLCRMTASLEGIEKALESIPFDNSDILPQVIRLVSEYYCQVVLGIPILGWLFNIWHCEIDELWTKRHQT